MRLLKSVRLAAVAAVMSACAGQAAADTVQLHYASIASALVTEVKLPLGTQSYYVGNYNIETRNPATSFVAYCIDPFQYATAAYTNYQREPLASFLSASTQKFADVTSLFAHSYAATLGNATRAAGFQLALWEIVNDDGNLAKGQVRLTGKTNSTAVAEAQNLLASLATSTWTTPATAYALTVYTNATQQDFISASPVPEPKTSVLMLAGLLVLGVATGGRRIQA